MLRIIKYRSLRITALLCSSLLLVSLPAQADRLSEQRRQYDQAKVALNKGDKVRFEQLNRQLSGYPLQPYLAMESLRKRLAVASASEVEQFLSSHGDLPAARGLKQTWFKRLLKEQDWNRLRQHMDPDSLTAEL